MQEASYPRIGTTHTEQQPSLVEQICSSIQYHSGAKITRIEHSPLAWWEAPWPHDLFSQGSKSSTSNRPSSQTNSNKSQCRKTNDMNDSQSCRTIDKRSCSLALDAFDPDHTAWNLADSRIYHLNKPTTDLSNGRRLVRLVQAANTAEFNAPLHDEQFAAAQMPIRLPEDLYDSDETVVKSRLRGTSSRWSSMGTSGFVPPGFCDNIDERVNLESSEEYLKRSPEADELHRAKVLAQPDGSAFSAWNLRISIYTGFVSAIVCRMKLQIAPGQSPTLLSINPSQWDLVYYTLDDRPPDSRNYAWVIDDAGNYTLLRQQYVVQEDHLEIDMQWEMRPFNAKAFQQGTIEVDLPSVNSHKILGGHLKSSMESGEYIARSLEVCMTDSGQLC